MASEDMESLLSFLVLSINHAFELSDFGTVAKAASEVRFHKLTASVGSQDS